VNTYPIFMIPLLVAACATAAEGPLRLNEVEVSMHMVLPVESKGRYYITGTTDLTHVWKGCRGIWEV